MSGYTSDIVKFKKHCKEISHEDAGGKSSWLALDELTEQRMTKVYALPAQTVPGLSFTEKQKQDKQLRGLWHQLTQHLMDLGYIGDKTFEQYWKQSKEILRKSELLDPIVEGVRTYLQEERADNILELINSTNPNRPFSRQWIEQHLGMIAEAISRYTSFDGVLPPPESYEIGEVSCYGRSLAFRMRVLFAMDSALDDVYIFDQSLLKYTIGLNNILQFEKDSSFNPRVEQTTIDEKFWRFTADIDRMFSAYMDALPKEISDKAFAVSYRLFQKQDSDGKLSFFIKNYQLIVSQQSAENLKGNSRKWTTKRIEKARKLHEGSYSYMACRLLQIKLWQTSFYAGAIDGDWAILSHHAAKAAREEELAHFQNLSKREQKRMPYSEKTIRRSIFESETERIVAIDVQDLYQILKSYVKTASPTSKKENVPDHQLIEQLNTKYQLPPEKIDKAVLEEKGLDKVYDGMKENKRRRVAFPSQGNRSFFRGLLRGIKKIAQWISKAIGKIMGVVFAFAKAIIDRVRKGVQLFCRGFRYISHLLLGRPFYSVEQKETDEEMFRVYLTKFRLDFDSINLIPEDSTPDGLKAHGLLLEDIKRGMLFFIDVVVFVIKNIGKLLHPGGWIWLGLQLFRFVFKGAALLLKGLPLLS